jgi:Electron transfer DM13
MRYQFLLLTMLSFSAVSITSNLPLTNAMPTVIPANTKPLATGSFVAAEHPTKGLVQIVEAEGKKFLKFDRAFKSDNGPDLFVILHNQNPPQAYDDSNYLSLGRLQKTTGEQMYEIPAGTDIASFQSVVIWCKQFNATFGFASLK